MATKPRIVIVGAGNFGSALGMSLQKAGYPIAAVVARPRTASLRKAGKLARAAGARATSDLKGIQFDVVWFCVPDGEITYAVRALAPKIVWKGKVVVHSSGALTSDELDVVRQKGATVASVHPLMTFVRESRPPLVGVPFAVEGDAAAVRLTRRIVDDLGGKVYSIRKADKAAYHAWGTFVSPLFTALLATSEQVAGLAGIGRKDARRRMIPILLQTLANYASFDAAGAFSGPIVRGDVNTIKRHLRRLRAIPAAREVYVALAHAALQFLPTRRKAGLRDVLRFGRR